MDIKTLIPEHVMEVIPQLDEHRKQKVVCTNNCPACAVEKALWGLVALMRSKFTLDDMPPSLWLREQLKAAGIEERRVRKEGPNV